MSHQALHSSDRERIGTDTAGDIRSRECPECGRTRLDRNEGEAFCPECGIVVSDGQLERTLPQWASDTARHVGPGQSTQWLQRGTCIGGFEDSTGQAARLEQFNCRLQSKDRTLYRGLRELRAICEELELGKRTRERAGYLYRKGVSEGLLKGRGIEEFAAASVLAAAREADYPLTMEWLAAAAFAERSEISSAYRTLLSALDLRILPPEPIDFVPRLVGDLGLPLRFERLATVIIEQVRETGLTTGKHPTGFAGAAIYAAAQREGRSLMQEEVATAAGVDTVTISRQWRNIDDELGIERE